MALFESLSCCVCLTLVEAAAPTSIDRVPMAERNQATVRLQTKVGISQWQDTRFFNIGSAVALQRFRTPFANITQDPIPCSTCCNGPATPRAGPPRVGLPCATPPGTAPPRPPAFCCQCTTQPRSPHPDHPTKHLYPSTSSSTLSLSIGTTLPQRNNSNTSVDIAITLHPHDAGQPHSSNAPFNHTLSTRCISFLTYTLVAFSPLTLSCVFFSQTRAIFSCVFFFPLFLCPQFPSRFFFDHGPSQLSRCQNCRTQGFRHQGQDLCQEDQNQVQSCPMCP